MYKQFLFGLFVFIIVQAQGMKPENDSKNLIKLHIYNNVTKDIVTLRCVKNWINVERSSYPGTVFLTHYKDEEFITVDDESITVNMRLDSCGTIEIRYAEKAFNNPLASLFYHWGSTNNRVSLHLAGQFLDKKSVHVNSASLSSINNVGLILKGKDLKDSYFYYTGMPEDQD